MSAALMSICMPPVLAYASSPEAIAREVILETGRLKLLSIMILIACIIASCLVAEDHRCGQKTTSWRSTLDIFCITGAIDP